MLLAQRGAAVCGWCCSGCVLCVCVGGGGGSMCVCVGGGVSVCVACGCIVSCGKAALVISYNFDSLLRLLGSCWQSLLVLFVVVFVVFV